MPKKEKSNKEEISKFLMLMKKSDKERLDRIAKKYNMPVISWCNLVIIRSLDEEERREKE